VPFVRVFLAVDGAFAFQRHFDRQPLDEESDKLRKFLAIIKRGDNPVNSSHLKPYKAEQNSSQFFSTWFLNPDGLRATFGGMHLTSC
jgi:hypothetical protein